MLPLKRALAAEVGPLLCCLACGGKLSSTDAASDGAPSDSTDRVLTSADEALDMLASFEWGQHSSAYSAWFEFERRGWDGRVYGAFDFLDPLMPFKECVVRRTGNCVISDCGDWIAEAEQYALGGSMEGDAELPTLEWFTLSSTLGDEIEFDVYDPMTLSSAGTSGGAWWGTFEGSTGDVSTSVWEINVRGGSLDGLSLSGFTLPRSPASAPEGSGVTFNESRVEISIPAGEDYQLSWQPPPDADFLQAYSDRGHLDTARCFFDGELGEGTLPAEVTQGFGLIRLGVANLQTRAFGEHLPRGEQTLVVLSAAALVDEGSGKSVILVPE